MSKNIYRNLKFGLTRRAKGFTLIEILVSIVVLSLGLLGVVSLQAASLRANQEARVQASASRFAEEFAELMRSNKNQALDTSSAYFGKFDSLLIPATTPNCFSTTPCTTLNSIAQSDLRDWLLRLNQELPEFKATICEDSKPFDVNGLPQWDCTAGGGVLAIKIGWTRGTFLRGGENPSSSQVFQKAADPNSKPGVILQFTPGNSK